LMSFSGFLKTREALIVSRGLMDTHCAPEALLVIFCEPLKKITLVTT
jgi:hypothetical protein